MRVAPAPRSFRRRVPAEHVRLWAQNCDVITGQKSKYLNSQTSIVGFTVPCSVPPVQKSFILGAQVIIKSLVSLFYTAA